MSITKDKVRSVFDETMGEPVLTAEDIPSIDLYMDQVLSLLGNIHDEDSSPLTKAMINNYSKDKLLTPVKGKKYSREQIIRILMIYYMKPALSIQSIKRVLSTLESASNIPEVYTNFLSIRSEQAKTLPGMVSSLLEGENELTEEEAALLVMTLCSLSGQLKLAASRIVDDCFVETEQVKEAKKKK